MPFDGNTDSFALTKLTDAIALLNRGLARVQTGYCWQQFYAPRTWYRKTPKFCMHGSLYFADDGHWERYNKRTYEALELAEHFLLDHTNGKSLIKFGTRNFARRRVIKAYKQALKMANVKLVDSL